MRVPRTRRLVRPLVAVAVLAAATLSPSRSDAAVVAPDATFAGDGVLAAPELLDTYGALTTDAAGRIVVVGLRHDDATMGHLAVARVLPDGTPDPAFGGADGVADLTLPAVQGNGFSVGDVHVLDDGSIVAFGDRRTTPGQPFSNGLWSLKLADDGTPAAGYGGSGVAVMEQGFTAFAPVGGVAADGSAVMVQQAMGGGFITRISPTGEFADVPMAPSSVPGCTAQPIPAGLVPVTPTEFVWAYQQGLYDGSACNGESDGGPVVMRQTIGGEHVSSSFVGTAYAVGYEGFGGNAVSLVGGELFLGVSSGAGASVVLQFATSGTVTYTLAADGAAPAGVVALGEQFAAITGPGSDGPVAAAVLTPPLSGTTGTSETLGTLTVGGLVIKTDIAATPNGFVVLARGDTGVVRAFTAPDIAPLEPGRLLDTRPAPDGATVDSAFVGNGPVGPGNLIKFRVAGRGGVPAGASAAVLNLTVVAPEQPGFATVYPCTPERPNASNINYTAGSFVANSVAASLDANGDVCVYTHARAHLIVDVNAFMPVGSGVAPLAPARVLDTRPAPDGATADGQALGMGAVGPAGFVKVHVAGRGGVAPDAAAVLLNLTIVAPEGPGFATVYPCTPEPPNASNINYTAGAFVANSVVAKVDANGDLCVYTHARSHVIVDVNGYVEPGADVGTLTPARLLDTRPAPDGATVDGQFLGAGPAGPANFVKVHVAGRGGVAPTATAAVLNLTVAAPEGPGFATVYPCTPQPPNASNINYTAGAFVANSVAAKLDVNGDVCLYTLARADLIVDVTGFVE